MMFNDVKDRTNGDGPLFVETQIGTVSAARPDQTAASLVSGILGDLQHLVEQQFQLTRREIEDEIRQSAIAAAVFASGAVVLFLGAAVFCLGLVHLLHWISMPRNADTAWLPLWACHAFVAAVLAVAGALVLYIGRVKFSSIHSFQNPLTELLQEHTA